MDRAEQPGQKLRSGAFTLCASDFLNRWQKLNPNQRARLLGCLTLSALLTAAFGKPLISLAVHAANTSLHSHIPLIPFICGYLLFQKRNDLPDEYRSSPTLALAPLAVGLAALTAALSRGTGPEALSHNDFLALMAFSYTCLLVTAGFLFLGRTWMAAAAFPVFFLFFIVPLPDAVVTYLETASQWASADAAALLFRMSSIPVFRDGLVFDLPGISIQVARECSGIRSSWVLFITSLLAGYLFLKSPWRRATLAAAAIPLGIIRNGFRILAIGLLCAHLGPEAIDGPLHKQGGPVFFALSLGPLVLLMWLLHRSEIRDRGAKKEKPGRPQFDAG